MPRAFLVKKRRESQTFGGHTYGPSLGTPTNAWLDVNRQMPYILSVAEPSSDIIERCGGKVSPALSGCSTIDNERSVSEDSLAPRIEADDKFVMNGVNKKDTDMPLDLSSHKTEPIPSRNLPSSPRSAFQPVQRVFVRHNSEAMARSQSLQRALHLQEFFDLPRQDVTNHLQNTTITSHELTYVTSKKVLSPGMCKTSIGQLTEDYIPRPHYPHYGMPLPLPYIMNQTSPHNRPLVLETDRDMYNSCITIPTANGSAYNDVVTGPNKHRLSSSPEHLNRCDNRSTIQSTSQSELVGGQLHKQFLKQHLVSVRGAMYLGAKQRQRQARTPVPGLEYIQNGSDTKLRDIIESECKEIDEGECLVKTEPLDSTPEVGQTTVDDTLASNLADVADKSQQPKKYMCDVCGKGFSRSNTLVTHKRIHTGDKPFKCEMCGRAFRQPGNLTRHRLTHTTVKPYVCSQCGKAFNRASNLHTHMRTHTNYKPFVCQYCGKGFHQKIDMKIHSYTHTGEKPHKCKKCGRGFKQLTHLTYHMRTHSDVKMYTCAYCGKGFNQKGNLQAHIYGHTGERPYKCEICGKGFTLASTLNTHRRTHADRKPFLCQHCGKDFYQKNALRSHVIASHPFTGPESML